MLPSAASTLAVLVVVVAAALCGRSPLLSNPGPEAGMVLAVVGGVAVALAQAVRGSARRSTGYLRDHIGGVVLVAVMVLVFLASTAIGALVAPSCSPEAGRFPMLVLSVPVLLLQAATGGVIGRIAGSRGKAIVACLVVEGAIAASIGVGLYDEPGFRAASHFFVVVSGDLLRGATLPAAAIGFRAATLLLAALVTLMGAAVWPAQRKTGLVSATAETWPLWLAAGAVGVVFLIAHGQARRALVPGRDELDDVYSLVKRRGALVVHADPLATTPREVDALLAEGALWHERLKTRLDGLSDAPIDVYVHADRAAQARWTGASHVDFTLPWRREIHVASARVPHRSLGHELAHVVAGEKSDTLLRVPARFVVFYAAAVTEGVAMALTPELAVDRGFTLQEQAAAMRRAGFLPDLKKLFSFARFVTEEPGRAYVAAGALVEQLVADAGPDAPRALERLYKGHGALEAAVVDVDDLLRRHLERLDATPLPNDAAGHAQARFRRPSVLDEVCERDAADEVRAIRALARTGDVDAALARAARLEGGRQEDLADGTLLDLVNDVSESGDAARTTSLLRRLVDDASSDAERALRQYGLGRALWRQGQEREAQAVWAGIDAAVLDVDLQRQLRAATLFADAAVRLAAEAPVARAALAFFVDDTPGRTGSRLAFAAAVGASSSEPAAVHDLARYVLGRQLVLEGALDEAVALLGALVAERRLDEVMHEQAVLALGVALVRSGRPDDAVGLFTQAAERARRPAMRLSLRDKAERARRAAQAKAAPAVATASSDPAWGDRLLLGASPDGEL
jgi:hypothetical protein